MVNVYSNCGPPINRRSLSVCARTNCVLLSTMSKNVAPAVAGTRGPLSFQPPPLFWDCKGAGFYFNDQTLVGNIFWEKGVAVDSQRELFEKKLKSPRWGAEN